MATTDGGTDFAELADGLHGTLSLPGAESWDQARAAWNLALDQRPDAVALVADAADVQAVVRFAAAAGLKVAPQSSGHGAAALGDLAGSILLRTAGLDTIDVDADAQVAHVGAGALWGHVAAAAGEHGLAAIAGSSPDVGVGGFALGAGTGWLSRKLGLSVNAIRSLDVVTGAGDALHIDAETETDLFWAARGGGGLAAVVTGLELQLFPVTEVYAGAMFFPLARAREIFGAYDRWIDTVPNDVSTSIRALRVPPLPFIPEPLRGQEFVVVDGAVIGSAAEGEAILAGLTQLGPVMSTWGPMPPSRLGEIHMDPPAPVPAASDGTSVSALPGSAIDALLELVGPGADTALLSVELRQLGGALSRPVGSGGVVSHLPGRYLVYGVGIAPDPATHARITAELDQLKRILAPWESDITYTNFTEHQLPAHRYWGKSAERLAEVVAHYDPDGVIRPAHPLLTS